MHFEFESTVRDSTTRIAKENTLGKLEAALELKISKIRNTYDKMDTLSRVQSADITCDKEGEAKLSILFDLNKPSIAHDILEAKNLLLELKLATKKFGANTLHRPLTEQKIETCLLAQFEQQLILFENRLTAGLTSIQIDRA